MIHLQVQSGFSFLRSVCGLEELVYTMKSYGMKAAALTDHNALYGAFKWVKLCEKMVFNRSLA
ncbi:PHP domain-containing protein [Bacillaceae bacterium SIJ1]|uniref:PHP domain-containing protein n=1 Tax=Litoribacterium kuwaitense TaxID=1398745 RepID=UPI0013EC6980|nr:PHP domain-containing protein [Litoribacterium kuwaitense]NGP45033.1 PHP domain-containing protein [Litoribacterium kuwaitense]